MPRSTVVHVTHEAVHKVGGIGAVLQGLVTAPPYADHVDRTILLGPLLDPLGTGPLGSDGVVLYDNWNGIWSDDVGAALYQVETDRGVRIVYGRRRLTRSDGSAVDPEVLLVDTSGVPRGLGGFKYDVHERFGLASDLYDHEWEFEQYMRLAEPGYDALVGLLGDDDLCYLIAHEFMGMGTVLKALMVEDRRFVTVFYAHEVATARRLVEDGPGRDVAFYNTLRGARDSGADLERVFGSQDDFFKHGLVRRAHHCDAIIAVGDWVVEELRLLGPEFSGRGVDVVYNGVPAMRLSAADKSEARDRLKQYAERLFGFGPDFVFTHVSRLVTSKGLWRDLLVLEHLDEVLARRGQTAVFIVLATETGPRTPSQVTRMIEAYGWPLTHREGHPDLSAAELEFDLQVRAFCARSRAIKVLFVNQFGWDAASCGSPMPADMSFDDLRHGTDVEFGQSIYEPFGIAQVEPLSCGAISIISDACGCLGFLQGVVGAHTAAVSREADKPSAGILSGTGIGCICGAYTQLPERLAGVPPAQIGADTCRQVEEIRSREVAAALAGRLSAAPEHLEVLLERGFAAASQMSWERVVEDLFVPALERARAGAR